VADTTAASTSPLRFGFRRRCAWCGVVLRGWQLNLCRLCGPKAKCEAGGPPCQSGSRWDAEPDRWRTAQKPDLSASGATS
jgi:hypothetical protein